MSLTEEQVLADRPTNAWTPAFVARLWKGRAAVQQAVAYAEEA